MKKNVLAWILSIAAGLLLLIMTSVSKSPATGIDAVTQNSQINLALREVADQLLKENKDLFSPIPPIQREKSGSYLITLGSSVDYFHLKSLVDAILKRHLIQPDYRLSLLDCNSGDLMLGFLALAKDENPEFPCQDRIQTTDCYNLRLELIDQHNLTAQNHPQAPVRKFHWWLMGLAVCFPLIWWTWQQKAKTNSFKDPGPDGWMEKTERTAFHSNNQILKINQQTETLTFREAKLLNFFFENANQVLEREAILQAVWEDEGIIVGRSLDVFVSRLRKKLKPDPDLNIVNVHGVGYRLEVR